MRGSRRGGVEVSAIRMATRVDRNEAGKGGRTTLLGDEGWRMGDALAASHVSAAGQGGRVGGVLEAAAVGMIAAAGEVAGNNGRGAENSGKDRGGGM